MQLKKAPPPVSDINVTPMVDVMLVVLIIFMVITPMLKTAWRWIWRRLATRSRWRMRIRKTRSWWRVTRDGKAFLSPGAMLMQPEELGEKVRSC